jgi:hypothetical protein
MNIHYKIAEVWPDDHLIVARYWTDKISEEFLASGPNRKEDGSPYRCRTDVSLTLPIPAPTGDDLDLIILKNCPIEFLKTLEAVVDPETDTSMKNILEMLGKTNSKTREEVERKIGTSTNVPPISDQLSDEEIRDLISKVTSTV